MNSNHRQRKGLVTDVSGPQRNASPGTLTYNKLRAQIQDKLYAWLEELSKVRILDPACGSGNFLYLALRRMLDLWREVYLFSAEHGLPTLLPHQVHPSQLYGLETNVYAHELASVVVWIGYLQWLNDNGIGRPTEPILRKLDNIQHRDAILDHEADGKPVEPAWPDAEFIIGNPPFLGGSKMRSELGDSYVETLRTLYDSRVPGGANLVTYWFEKSRAQIAASNAERAGLLATQAIRAGANRKVLERIKASGGIFMAWSSRNWILDGASVGVSLIGFDNGKERNVNLNGLPERAINSDLTAGLDMTEAKPLPENKNIAHEGVKKYGSFEIDKHTAERMLQSPMNPNGRANSDVIVPWINGDDLTERPHGRYIINFTNHWQECDAALYEIPFEYLKQIVYPERQKEQNAELRLNWWLFERRRPALMKAIRGLDRYIATPRVSKHRTFSWMSSDVVPDTRVVAIACSSDLMIGILQSQIHKTWSLRKSSRHGDGDDGGRVTYNKTTCFDTYPFPWPPGHEPKDSPLVEAIGVAARELIVKRDAWFNPPDASAEELKKRTLTNLYNSRPSWLVESHRKLDEAVFAAYGWPSTLTDAELLERLLALNHQRAASQETKG